MEFKNVPVLEVRGLGKRFGSEQVLKQISFTMERGQVLVILGTSGSGKTTLLRCLNFLEQPEQGEILVSGEHVFRAGQPEQKESVRRRNRLHFGMVFQAYHLFPQYTVLENITLAPKLAGKQALRDGKNRQPDETIPTTAQVEENAKALLNRVGLMEKANAYPGQLSGGQQQRVAIARALALAPDILCFDEPTSALDPELTGEVLQVIRQLKDQNRTMIVVTHEMNFAREVADKVIFMEKGVIAEEGSVQQVFCETKTRGMKAFLSKAL